MTKQTIYQIELQNLRPDDNIYEQNGSFITTAAHGYLVVPKESPWANVAHQICEYGYRGTYAYYLEEDCEAPEFLKRTRQELCKTCGKLISKLEAFPGPACLDCHEREFNAKVEQTGELPKPDFSDPKLINL